VGLSVGRPRRHLWQIQKEPNSLADKSRVPHDASIKKTGAWKNQPSKDGFNGHSEKVREAMTTQPILKNGYAKS